MQSDYGIAAEHIKQQHQNFAVSEEQMLHSLPSIPITQPFLQHQHQEHFSPSSQQLQRVENRQQNIGEPPPLQHLRFIQETPCHPLQFAAVNFKLGLNESSAIGIHQTNDVLDQQQQTPSPPRWQTYEDSSTKDPFWRHLNSNTLNRRCSEGKLEERPLGGLTYYEQDLRNRSLNVNVNQKYRIFGELEAICGQASLSQVNHQTGSGSALTSGNCEIQLPNVTADGHGGNFGTAARLVGIDHGSEESVGGEASLDKFKKSKRKCRKLKDQLSSMACFFEGLIKQMMYSQESLQMKFMERIERMDQERKDREEARRQQEAERNDRQAIARANEQALASSREAVIISCLEKIIGQKINLPSRHYKGSNSAEPPRKNNHCAGTRNTIRWPRAEVEALVRVRSSFEPKFRGPGLKGPLWEEISSILDSIGYQRSAKRCKEKWENINKYFKKTKDGARKRPRQVRTCSYFDQLDQLYARSLAIDNPSPNSSSCSMPMDDNAVGGVEREGNSQFLDAISDMGGSENNLRIGISKVLQIGSYKVGSLLGVGGGEWGHEKVGEIETSGNDVGEKIEMGDGEDNEDHDGGGDGGGGGGGEN